MCDLEAGSATGAPAVDSAVGFAGELTAAPLFEAAIIAFNSFSVTPDFCNRINSGVEVLNCEGCAWIAEITTVSGNLFLTIVMMSSLVIGFCDCCAEEKVC